MRGRRRGLHDDGIGAVRVGGRHTPRADEPEDVDAKTGLAGAVGIGAITLAVGLPPLHWTCGRRRVVCHTTDPHRPIE